jgi:uncharacterized delta-60 repeat protein
MKWRWLFVTLTFIWGIRGEAASLVDTSFEIGTGADGLVEQVLELPDGKVLICGNFTTFNGKDRSYIARLNSNGTVDLSFDAHPNYWVRHMAVQQDGKIVIGGYFVTVSDVPRNLIARLNADGSLDTIFDPGTGATDIIAGGVDGNMTPFVFWVEIQPDQKILITGNFRNYNGESSTGLARLNPDGRRDETFKFGWGLDSWGRVIKLASNGQIYVGGWFTSISGNNANRLARLNSDGTFDDTFKPYYGDRTAVYAIAELPDGKLITAGHSADESGSFKEIVRLNPDGSIDPAWQGSTNEKTESLLLLRNGKLLVGGYFSSMDGSPRPGIGRLNEDGTLDDVFYVNLDNFVWTVAPGQNDKIYISGGFDVVDGLPRAGVARLNLPETTGPISTPKPDSPQLANARIEDNKFRLTLATTPGLIYTLEGTDDPAGTWAPLLSIRALQTSLDFEDPSLGTKRFYRVEVH